MPSPPPHTSPLPHFSSSHTSPLGILHLPQVPLSPLTCIASMVQRNTFSVNCRWPVQVMLASKCLHIRDTSGTHQGHTRDISGTHQGHIRDTPGTHQGHTRDTPGTHQGHTRDTPGTHQGHTRDIPGTH